MSNEKLGSLQLCQVAVQKFVCRFCLRVRGCNWEQVKSMTVVKATPVTTLLAFRKQDVHCLILHVTKMLRKTGGPDWLTACLPDLGSNTAAPSLLTHYVQYSRLLKFVPWHVMFCQIFCQATVRDVLLPYSIEARISALIKAKYGNCMHCTITRDILPPHHVPWDELLLTTVQCVCLPCKMAWLSIE